MTDTPSGSTPPRETIVPADDSADDLLRPSPGLIYPPDPPDLVPDE
ncbi:hypothetical protein ACFW4K_26880 [Nocardiopsis alba]